MRILVTGGCGFIGHHMVEHLIKNTDWEVVIIDKLTYASNGFDRLRDINCFDNKRITTFTTDFSHPITTELQREIGPLDYIIHLGAETHVDRSIQNPEPFIINNILGTMHILDLANRQPNLTKMIYFSTDEVFGPAPDGTLYKEWDRYNSSNPYAATKAGAEELCLAYANTYKTPVLISHSMNAFGERQDPEKFIPGTLKKVLAGEIVLIHSSPDRTKPGSRFYIHARNIAAAMLFLLDKGEVRDKYNVVGEKEINNLELARFIADVAGKPLSYEMVDFHSSRPGHDLRYALDGTKMYEMGWRLPVSFEDSLRKVIEWTLRNQKWLRKAE